MRVWLEVGVVWSKVVECVPEFVYGGKETVHTHHVGEAFGQK